MCHSTLAIYCFIDDFLKLSGHREDCRTEVTDAELITIALTAMLHFGGNFQKSRVVLHELGLMKRRLSQSRFSRRVNRLADLIYRLFHQFGAVFKKLDWQSRYVMRKHIETTIGEVMKLFPKKIHATNLNGFLLKIALFLFAYQIDKAFIQ